MSLLALGVYTVKNSAYLASRRLELVLPHFIVREKSKFFPTQLELHPVSTTKRWFRFGRPDDLENVTQRLRKRLQDVAITTGKKRRNPDAHRPNDIRPVPSTLWKYRAEDLEMEEAMAKIDLVQLEIASETLMVDMTNLNSKYQAKLAKIKIEPEVHQEVRDYAATVLTRVEVILEPLLVIIENAKIQPRQYHIKGDPTVDDVLEDFEAVMEGVSQDKSFPAVAKKCSADFGTLYEEIGAKLEELSKKYPKFGELVNLSRETIDEANSLFIPLRRILKPALDVINRNSQF